MGKRPADLTVALLIADAVVFAGEVGTAGSDGTVSAGLALGVAHKTGIAPELRARLVAATGR
jgi:hypothetical protein